MAQATKLLCNGIENPLGVDSPRPSFSWRAASQSAYRLIAADSADALENCSAAAWDSGRVPSDSRMNVLWGGAPLRSATRYTWKIKLWDEEGNEGPWSRAAWFETGLLHPSDWRGKWICAPKPATPAKFAQPAPYFRKSFLLDGVPVSARAYVCGLGYFELYVNGRKVGRDVLTPPFTKYDATCLYCTYDITGMLVRGENVLGAVLGNGMYFMQHGNAWDFEKAPWKDNPKLLLQAEISLDSGKTVSLCTGSDWKVSTGPIVNDCLYAGETYDARLEMPGWSSAGFDDSAWKHAAVCRSPGGRLVSMQMEGIRVVEEFAPASVKEVRPDVWVFDMGRNIAGWARLKVSGPAGTTVRLQYAEKLDDTGDIDDSNISRLVECDSFQTDAYTLKGCGVETWEPRFTYHGFQYVRVTGFPGTPGPDALTACVVHTDLATGGGFRCSDELANKIQEAARASTLNNWHGMPTDCPHREKNGWTGDALLSCEQALLNFKPLQAYRKWLDDIIDCQRPSGQLPGIAPTGGWGYNWGSGPAWDSILVLLPWNIYVHTGDTSVLARCWDAIVKYLGFMDSMSEDGVVDFGLGDWCPPAGGADGHKTPTAVSDTWYYHADTLTAAKIAGALGKKAEAAHYAGLAESIRQAFLKRFVDERTGDVAGSCQTSYALALQYGITRGELAGKVFAKLVDEVERCRRHIDCGILGAKTVPEVLTAWGRADLAWAIVSQRDFPSWGHWILQGATTLWDMWNGDGSRNHHMFSSVSGFFHKCIAGLNPDETMPGFRHILFRPNPVPGLQWAESWHESPFGVVRIRWEKAASGLKLSLEVPEGSAATLTLPGGYPAASVGGGEPARIGDGLRLGPGFHTVVAEPASPDTAF